MGTDTLKPDSGNQFVIADEGGSNSLVISTDGTVSFSQKIKINGFAGYDATQAISSGSFVEFTGETKAFSTHFTTATFSGGRFTADKAGFYQVNASFECPLQDDGMTFQLDIRVNGSGAMSGYMARQVQYSPKTNANLGNALSTVVFLDGVDDYVSCYCYIEDNATVSCYQFNGFHIGST